MPPPQDMAYWLGQKYAILGKQAEGEFQKNVAEAYKTREEGGQVAPNAASLRDMQGSQSFLTREQGKQVAPNAESLRDLQGAEAYRTREQGISERTGRFIDPAAAQIIRDMQKKAHPDLFAPSRPGVGVPGVVPGLGGGATGQRSSLDLPSLTAPLQQTTSLRPMYQWNADTQSPEAFRKGTPDVKAKSSGGPPKGLEAMLPALLAAMQGGGAPAPAGPRPAGLKKGTANVKGKSKGSKTSKGDDQPSGLEALLAALQGGGAADPQAAGPPMPMAPGAAAPPGFARGTPSVDPRPGYPFGAGYLFGTTAVPGQGSGTVDTVNAKLAPHEAVLNRAAADMMGRGLISALNNAGVRQMGLR